MLDLAAFRSGEFSVPYASKDELPHCCFTCVYLQVDETTVCFCASFYYYCAYGWPDILTNSVPPCLSASQLDTSK